MKPLDHRSQNRHAWNQLARSGNRFARPAKEEDFIAPLESVDGPGWLEASISGKQVLCLAAGGGRQGPVYAAAGASVTVVDISDEMLMLDRQIAQRKKLNLRTIETSMEDLSMLADQTFDIVIQPVSTCYVPELAVVFNEIARVLRHHGIYISQHKQPSSLQTSVHPTPAGYVWQYVTNRQPPLPAVPEDNLVREPGTLEFVHSWESILGGICRSGFVIEDVIEPDHTATESKAGSFEHRSQFVSPYLRILARRNTKPVRQFTKIWFEQ